MTKHSTQAAGDRVSRPKRPTTVEHTRKRTQVACERCRKRKIKCSLSGSEDGCETCNNAGEKCVVNRVGSKEYTFELNPSNKDGHKFVPDPAFGVHNTAAGQIDSRHYQHGLLTPSASSRQGSVNSMPSTSHSSPYRSNLADQYGYGPLPGPLAGSLSGPPIGITTSYRTINGTFGAAMPDSSCAVGSFAPRNESFYGNNPWYSIQNMPSARLVPQSDHAPTTNSGVATAHRPNQRCQTATTNNQSGGHAAQARVTADLPPMATPPRAQSYSRRSYTSQAAPSSSNIPISPGTFPSSEGSFSPTSSMHSQQSPTTSAPGSFTADLDDQRMNMASYATMTTSSLQATQHPDTATYAPVYPRRPSYGFAPYGLPTSTSALAQANHMSAIQNNSLGYSPTTASYQYQPYYPPANSRGPAQGRLSNGMEYVPYNYYGPGAQQTHPRHRRHNHHHHQDLADDHQPQSRGHPPVGNTAQWQQRNGEVEPSLGMEMSGGQERVQ